MAAPCTPNALAFAVSEADAGKVLVAGSAPDLAVSAHALGAASAAINRVARVHFVHMMPSSGCVCPEEQPRCHSDEREIVTRYAVRSPEVYGSGQRAAIDSVRNRRHEGAMARILIVDDEARLGRVLVEMLEGAGHDVAHADGGAAAIVRIAAGDLDIVVSDLRMPQVDGMAVLGEVRRVSPGTDVVLMTAHATAQNAVEAMKQGAVDYLVKPFAMDEFRLRIGHIVERRAITARADALARRLDAREGFGRVVAESAAMHRVVADARRVAATDETVLLLGESGTGKNLLARAIHHASGRAAGPFIEVHAAALPETLVEGEPFGRERGAYTGAADTKPGHAEAAHGGTLFLDEIGELAPAIQVKLLRFLQDRTFTRL